MASGILGKADLSAATNTTIYTAPSSRVSSATISICNRNATAARIRLALAATGTPTASEYIEYDFSVQANGVLERNGVVIDAGKNIVAYSDTANVSVLAYGWEE